MVDRKSLLLSGVLVIAGEMLYQVALYFHAEAGPAPQTEFTAYANSASWALVHEGQFAGYAIVIFGMLTLFFALDIKTGVMSIVARCAAATMVAALALHGALYGVDGVGLKQAIDAWISAPASQQYTFWAVVQGIRGIEWGLRSYVDFTAGLSLILLAIAITVTAKIPRLIGIIMALSGLAYLAQGYTWGTGYTAIPIYPVVVEKYYQYLTVLWAISLLVVAWRSKASVQAATA